MCGVWRKALVGQRCGLCASVFQKKRLETQRHREHGEGKKEVEGEIGRGII
jgi:hypothetical protein